MRSRAQTIAIILSKYKKRNGAQKRDAQSFPARLSGQKHWVAPDGKQHDVSEDHLRDLQDLTGRTVNAYDAARQSGWMRGFVNADEVNVDLSGTDPIARANAKAYIREHWRKGMSITMDMSDPSGNLTYWKRHTTPLTAFADLAQDVPLDTSTAFAAKSKPLGLRATINKLKAQGHRASDYVTLFHGTSAGRAKKIIKEGFNPNARHNSIEDSYGGHSKRTFFASRKMAGAYDAGALLKVRLPKALFKGRSKANPGESNDMFRTMRGETHATRWDATTPKMWKRISIVKKKR